MELYVERSFCHNGLNAWDNNTDQVLIHGSSARDSGYLRVYRRSGQSSQFPCLKFRTLITAGARKRAQADDW